MVVHGSSDHMNHKPHQFMVCWICNFGMLPQEQAMPVTVPAAVAGALTSEHRRYLNTF